MSIDVRPPPAGGQAAPRPLVGIRAGYGSVLALTVVFSAAGCLLLICAVLLVVHPPGSGFIAQVVIGQNQRAKTVIYLVSFAVVLPLALFAVPRAADAIASGPNGPALPFLAAALAATFATSLLLVRLSGVLPWGDGLGVALAATGLWSMLALWMLARALRPRPLPLLLRCARFAGVTSAITALLVFGTLLAVTSVGSLSATPLALGAVLVVAVLVAYGRVRVPRLGRLPGGAFDLVAIVVLVLAVPNVVVFTSSAGVPNVYFEPGIIQFQQDWILGPANQLVHGGGTLLVNVPSSQYGVGLVYFLAAWFHLAPIGYGTFGLLDGILTALLYVAGYLVLRIAGASRLMAAATLAFGVVVFAYALHFRVGALPEQGPLRFGLPMLVILPLVAGERWPRRMPIARAVALVVLGVSSIWAVEAFAYTAFTFAAMVAMEAWLGEPDRRRRWLLRQLGLAVAACVAAHLIFALATLAAVGQLPHWGQYLAFVRALLLGGREGSITYGFANWSPGLAMGAACLASAAAVVLLVRRIPAIGGARRTTLIALTGTTAYGIASFSYTDNRSSTYLLLYVALPMLMAAALWLGLLLDSGAAAPPHVRLGGLSFALCVAVLMLAAAWPAVGSHFSQSALAHAYPGGGLRASLHRLWHPPPIDPRAPEGQRLLRTYLAGRRPLLVLPDWYDLGIEMEMRGGLANPLFVGDPSQDGFVPSVWIPKVRAQLAALRAGQPILTDVAGLRAIARLRGRRSSYALAHPALGDNPQQEWILHQIDLRFVLQPIYVDRDGFVVARLVRR